MKHENDVTREKTKKRHGNINLNINIKHINIDVGVSYKTVEFHMKFCIFVGSKLHST